MQDLGPRYNTHSKNQNIKVKRIVVNSKLLKSVSLHQKKKEMRRWLIVGNEATKAMSGIGGLSARPPGREGRRGKGRKDSQEEEGGRNRFETWLALEAAAQRTGGSPGLSPGIENPSQDRFTGGLREPGRKFCFKGFPSSPRALCLSRLPTEPPLPQYLVPGLEMCEAEWGGRERCGRGKGCRAKEATHTHAKPVKLSSPESRAGDGGGGKDDGGRSSA